jgi:acetoin utilization deacetylase AcuC-like enzyme
MEVAHRHAKGRVVSTLEGGYNTEALARCVVEHVRVLAG